MEEGKYHEVDAGTPQGGVISPILANLYLNELDWKLEEHGIRFVRYADDFLLFAKTEEEIRKAAEVTRETLAELGLEVAMEKTKMVNFKKDDFDFLGFTFEHWRERKKDGRPVFHRETQGFHVERFQAESEGQDTENPNVEQESMAGTCQSNYSREGKLFPEPVQSRRGKQAIWTGKSLFL
ncbi:hypothetical protein PAJ34TS1_39360 [Paenibacillus azoreducens]